MNLFNRIINNPFLKNVSILASGTIISQIIVVAMSPILTRLYTVEAFGTLSLFASFMVIFSVVTTGRYELAIGLPEKDEKAKNLIKLIFILGFVVSIIYLLILFISIEIFQYSDSSGLFQSKWIYLAPIYIFFIAIYSSLIYWNQRKKKYKKITISNAVQVISTTVFSLFFGFFGLIESGMLISLVLGIIISSIFLLYDFNKRDLTLNIDELKKVGKDYISFPKYMILSDLSITTGQQYIPIIFSSLFSTTIVGYYSLANRMIRLPNIIITTSITNVFRNDAIDEIRKKGNCGQLYRSIFKKLLVLSLPIYISVFVFSPILFTFLFGEKWLMAGNFARILSVLLLIEFIATPLNCIFYITHRQKIFMRLQIINTIFGGLLIYLGYRIFNDSYYSLVLFCFNSIIFNLLFIYLTYSYSKKVVVCLNKKE